MARTNRPSELSARRLLVDSAQASALFGALVLGSLAYEPMIWYSDYPAAMKEKAGPQTPRGKRLAYLVVGPLLLLMVGSLVVSNRRLARQRGGPVVRRGAGECLQPLHPGEPLRHGRTRLLVADEGAAAVRLPARLRGHEHGRLCPARHPCAQLPQGLWLWRAGRPAGGLFHGPPRQIPLLTAWNGGRLGVAAVCARWPAPFSRPDTGPERRDSGGQPAPGA
jgi:hypothetical protein